MKAKMYILFRELKGNNEKISMTKKSYLRMLTSYKSITGLQIDYKKQQNVCLIKRSQEADSCLSL